MIKLALATGLALATLIASLNGARTAEAMPVDRNKTLCDLIDYCMTRHPTTCGWTHAQQMDAGAYYSLHC